MARVCSQFQPGVSGNPKGRPPGTGKAAKLRALLTPHAPALIQKTVDLALSGDTTALKLCLERLLPPLRPAERTVAVSELKEDLPLVEQGQAIIGAFSRGDISPSDGAKLLSAIAAQARIVELTDLERRLKALENSNHRNAA